MSKKVLMVCYGGGHVKIIYNLYKKLKDEKNIEIVILALTKAQEFLKNENIEYMTLEKYTAIFGQLNEIEVKSNQEIQKELGVQFSDKESMLYYFYGTIDIIKKFGIKKVIEGYKKYGRRIFLPITFIKKVIEYENPDLVITTNAPRMEKVALMVANEKGIETISIEDLLGVSNPIEKEIKKFFKSNIYKESFGKNICVLSEITKANLEKRTKSNIFITGNPNFDTIFNSENSYKEVKKDLCYLTQYTKENLKIFELLLNLLKDKKLNKLIIKIHPNEDKEKYHKLNNKYGNIAEIEEDLYKAILKSDVVLTEYSTAGIEAIILGKHVISREDNKVIDFKKLGENLVFRNILDIPKIIDLFFNDKKFKIKNSELKVKQNAGKTIVKLVKNILKIE